jgi:citronellol/citronellal dehydrogenase
LAQNGVDGLDRYRVDPTQPLVPDLFVPDDIPPPNAHQRGARPLSG